MSGLGRTIAIITITTVVSLFVLTFVLAMVGLLIFMLTGHDVLHLGVNNE